MPNANANANTNATATANATANANANADANAIANACQFFFFFQNVISPSLCPLSSAPNPQPAGQQAATLTPRHEPRQSGWFVGFVVDLLSRTPTTNNLQKVAFVCVCPYFGLTLCDCVAMRLLVHDCLSVSTTMCSLRRSDRRSIVRVRRLGLRHHPRIRSSVVELRSSGSRYDHACLPACLHACMHATVSIELVE